MVASIIYAGAPGADAGTERIVAQKIQTLFIDDLDGSPAEGTVGFVLDGTSYEIDLSGEHAQALRGALSRYIDAARRAPGTQRPARSRRRKPSAGDPDSTEVREWARSQGIDVKDRGRIPAELVVEVQSRDHAVRPRFRRPRRRHRQSTSRYVTPTELPAESVRSGIVMYVSVATRRSSGSAFASACLGSSGG
jgi:Lsr2